MFRKCQLHCDSRTSARAKGYPCDRYTEKEGPFIDSLSRLEHCSAGTRS
jgi:hypothetical protein